MWGIGLVGYMGHWYANFFSIPESRRKKSERVLVFSELGISRAATAAIAYLIKGKQWSLKVRIVQTNQCRGFCASRVTLARCEQWGWVFLICHSCAGVLWACEAVQTPHQATASVHGAAVQLGNPSPWQNPHKPHPLTALTHALHALALTLQHILQMSQSLFMMSNCTQYTYKPCHTYQHTQSSFSEWVCIHGSYAWLCYMVNSCCCEMNPPNLIYSTQNKTHLPIHSNKAKESTPKNVCRTIRHESTRTMNAFAYCCYQMDPNNFCCSSQALAGEVVCGTPGEQLKEEIVRCQRVWGLLCDECVCSPLKLLVLLRAGVNIQWRKVGVHITNVVVQLCCDWRG